MASKRESLIASAEKSLAKGKVEPALKEYLKVLDETPNDINILSKVGELYARLNRNEEALPYFTRIAEHYSKDGFYLKAIAMFRRINRLDPSRLDVYDRLGELYNKQGLAMEAKSQYQVLADYYLKQDNLAGVIGIYGKMLQIEPNNIQLHVKLADLYTQAKKIQDALKEYLVVAQMLKDRNALPEAIQVYEKALKLAPDNFEILRILVPLLAESGRSEEGRTHLRRAIETTPRSTPLFVLAAETAMNANDMAEARTFGAKAQSVDPENEDVVNLVVKIHIKSRRPDLAYQSALPLVEQSLKRGEAKKAIGLLVSIAKLAPENEDLLKKVVDAHTAAGDQRGSVPFRASLADIWKKQGKIAEAAEALRFCTRLAPDNTEYRAQLSHLESQLPPPEPVRPAVVEPPREQARPPARQQQAVPAPPPQAERQTTVRPPAGPVATPSGEFEIDFSDDEGRPPSRPAIPVPAPPAYGASPRFPTFGSVTGGPPPGGPQGFPPPPGFGQFQTPTGPGYGSPVSAGGDLELEIGAPVYEKSLPVAEEIEDAVEVEIGESSGISEAVEVIDEAVEVVGPDEVAGPGEVVGPDVDEAVEVVEEPPLATQFPPASQAPSWAAQYSVPPPAPAMPEPAAHFPPPMPEPVAALPVVTAPPEAAPPFAAPPVTAPPPLPGPPPVAASPAGLRSVSAETEVEEALVEAEIFRKYGLYDKAADQLRLLLPRFSESLKVREKLFEVLLEQGKKDLAREQADELMKLYAESGREDRIRGLKGLLGEPQPPSGVQEGPKAAAPPLPVEEAPPAVEVPAVPPPPVAPAIEAIEVPEGLFTPPATPPPPMPAQPMAAAEILPEPVMAPPPVPVVPPGVSLVPPPMPIEAAPVIEVELPVAPPPVVEMPPPVPPPAPAVVAEEKPVPAVAPHPVAPPPVRPRLSPQDLAAALAMPQAAKAAPKKEKKPELDPLAQLGLGKTTVLPVQKAPSKDSGKTARLDLLELDALAGLAKPKKAVPRTEEIKVPDLLADLAVPAPEPPAPVASAPPVELPVVPPPMPEPEIPVLPIEEPALLAPEPVTVVPAGPTPEELSEIDFCLDQGMVVDAAERLQTLEGRFPGHPDVAARRLRLEGGSAEDAKKAINEIFSEDLEMVLDAELGKALTDEMAKGAAEPAPGPEVPSVQVDESGLFSDEQDFFNFAEELQSEMKQESIVEKAAGPQQEVSLEEIFREFKKGVEQQLSPEDYETHYNLGIAYKEMGLTDEAIGEFQIASKDPLHAVECCSMLGLCFLEKSLPQLAIKWYRKGLETPGILESDRLGLQYDLASVYANVGDSDNAHKTFLEIYGTDASFRDVADRIKEFEAQAN